MAEFESHRFLPDTILAGFTSVVRDAGLRGPFRAFRRAVREAGLAGVVAAHVDGLPPVGCLPLRGSISEAESKSAVKKRVFPDPSLILYASLRDYSSFAGAKCAASSGSRVLNRYCFGPSAVAAVTATPAFVFTKLIFSDMT